MIDLYATDKPTLTMQVRMPTSPNVFSRVPPTTPTTVTTSPGNTVSHPSHQMDPQCPLQILLTCRQMVSTQQIHTLVNENFMKICKGFRNVHKSKETSSVNRVL